MHLNFSTIQELQYVCIKHPARQREEGKHRKTEKQMETERKMLQRSLWFVVQYRWFSTMHPSVCFVQVTKTYTPTPINSIYLVHGSESVCVCVYLVFYLFLFIRLYQFVGYTPVPIFISYVFECVWDDCTFLPSNIPCYAPFVQLIFVYVCPRHNQFYAYTRQQQQQQRFMYNMLFDIFENNKFSQRSLFLLRLVARERKRLGDYKGRSGYVLMD